MKTTIPDLSSELHYKTSRSGGKGGQNVNKVSSKVEIIFYPATSQLLDESSRDKILKRLENRLSNDGGLHIVSQSERSQLRNKHIAQERLYNLLTGCLVEETVRKATKTPRSVIERRLIAKKRKGELKRFRREKDW